MKSTDKTYHSGHSILICSDFFPTRHNWLINNYQINFNMNKSRTSINIWLEPFSVLLPCPTFTFFQRSQQDSLSISSLTFWLALAELVLAFGDRLFFFFSFLKRKKELVAWILKYGLTNSSQILGGGCLLPLEKYHTYRNTGDGKKVSDLKMISDHSS